MKKINILLTIFLSMIFIGNVKAASAHISLSPSNKTILVGNTITIDVTVSSTSTLGGGSFTVSYDSNMLSLVSTDSPTGGARTVFYFNDTGHTQASYSYTFKALASGNTTVSIQNGAEAGDDKGNNLSVSTGSSSIKIMTQRELEATYSSNNNLESLSVEGYELTPAFDKDTLEYSVKLKPETEAIFINASKEDAYASVNGAGTVAVSEGSNTIKIDVVAENGNIKSYTINAIVEEYDPISVKVDGVAYTVVRSKKVQTFSNDLFKETKIKIGEYDVPAYYNEVTKKTVVALKDMDGKIGYFVYDNNKYTKFSELKLNSIDLMLLDTEKVPEGYTKDTVTINEIEYPAYRIDNSRFLLMYGVNLANNNEGFYVYDNYENTLQRYDSSVIDGYQDKMDRMTYIIYILSGAIGALIILLFISLYSRSSKPKKVKEVKPKDDFKQIDEVKTLVEAKKTEDVKDIETLMNSIDTTKEMNVIKEAKKEKKKTKKK